MLCQSNRIMDLNSDKHLHWMSIPIVSFPQFLKENYGNYKLYKPNIFKKLIHDIRGLNVIGPRPWLVNSWIRVIRITDDNIIILSSQLPQTQPYTQHAAVEIITSLSIHCLKILNNIALVSDLAGFISRKFIYSSEWKLSSRY